MANQLTEAQKIFLLNTFFHDDRYSGWENIATKLLETGRCIVAGTECIWKGGIGNFIKMSIAEDAIDCSLYTFDLDYFLSSEWYKEISGAFLEELDTDLAILQKQIKEIKELK